MLTPVTGAMVALIMLVITILLFLAYAIREIGQGWEDMERLGVVPPTPQRRGLFDRFMVALAICISMLIAVVLLVIYAL